MLTIIRDRFQDAVQRKQTLDQVKAASLCATTKVDTAPPVFWTTDAFVDAPIRSLRAPAMTGALMRGKSLRCSLRCVSVLALISRRGASRPGAGTRRRPAAAAVSARGSAPIDLTGYWVSVVTEDWRWRMVTPPKGDYASVPMTPRGPKIADTWDAAEGRIVPGLRRRRPDAHADAPAHHLGVRHHPQDRDRRRPADAPARVRPERAVPAARSLQGFSLAEWERAGGVAGRCRWWAVRRPHPGGRPASGNLEGRHHEH